jgi:hypothetical protein
MTQPDLLRKIFLRVGSATLELEGERLSLTSPAVYDLIARTFTAGSGTDPETQTKLDALKKDLAASGTPLAKSVADNTPKP